MFISKIKINIIIFLSLTLLFLIACSTDEPAPQENAFAQATATEVVASVAISTKVVEPTGTSLPSITSVPPSVTLIPSSTSIPILSPSTTVTLTPWPEATSGPTPTYVPGWHTVKSGDTPFGIAFDNDMSLDQLLEINYLDESLRIDVGDILAVWKPIWEELPDSYLIHDSEVAYSPAYAGWDTTTFVAEKGGFLASYSETMTLEGEEEAKEVSGAEIIDMIALKYHIGPRALLGAMELMSGWVTKKTPSTEYAFGLRDPARAKLSRQAAWAAEAILHGYYMRLEGRSDWVIPTNGIVTRLHPNTSPGSAGIMYMLSRIVKPAADLVTILEEERFQKTYRNLFGELNGGPVMPPDGKQPYFAMPWPDGQRWSFSGGPHGGYVDFYSGWAALDFAPPLKNGCRVSKDYPISAISSGLVVSSDKGETWIDLDEDGDIHTGWSLLYMHLATEGRIEQGARVETGDQLGFPSCEGGSSSASHVHIARMYNGQWMPADGPVPFQIGDWTAQALLNNVYRGFLTNAVTDYRLESCFCRIVEKNIFPGSDPVPPTLTP